MKKSREDALALVGALYVDANAPKRLAVFNCGPKIFSGSIPHRGRPV